MGSWGALEGFGVLKGIGGVLKEIWAFLGGPEGDFGVLGGL